MIERACPPTPGSDYGSEFLPRFYVDPGHSHIVDLSQLGFFLCFDFFSGNRLTRSLVRATLKHKSKGFRDLLAIAKRFSWGDRE